MQINLMKFTYQHLSTLEHDNVESYVDYKDNFSSYQAVYVYPGNSVPEWLEYKTTKDDLIVDLSPPHLSSLMGFVLCFILVEDYQYSYRIELKITTIDHEGDGEKDGVIIYMNKSCFFIESNHVCMIYDQQFSHYLTSLAKSRTRFKIKVKARTESIRSHFRERRKDCALYHLMYFLPPAEDEEFDVDTTFDALVAAFPISVAGKEAYLKRIAKVQVQNDF
ncbi:hypothetical protein TSUD_262380 [Trifolium subterraneum]|nr:hypothetical protein TSUD_262380 [Trifolium subterraneum]